MTRRLLALLFLVVFGVAGAQAQRRRAASPQDYSDLHLAGLFSMTGDGSSLGQASAAALELAVRDINSEFGELRVPIHVTFEVVDTQLTASLAAQRIQEVYARGARIVIGPQSSAEAGAMLAFANEHGMVVISQASTASSLAIPNDALFRLAPNDKLEGAAQAALMIADGIDTIMPMWRDDAGNTGLRNSTSAAFTTLGGTSFDGITYAPTTTNFTPLVTVLGNAIRGIKNTRPNAKVAIYLASFEEAVDIMNLARLDADLSAIRWYGGDGVAQSQALLADANVAAFAAHTSFTAPNVGLDEGAKFIWQPLSDEIKAKIGFTPDAYALSVYDAAWAAALAAAEVDNDEDRLQAAFAKNVQRYFGATGSTALDAAGDRFTGAFDFWTIKDTNGTKSWVRTAQYSGGHVSR
jgi:branched-chain amino acid transport system substrate-binding protein